MNSVIQKPIIDNLKNLIMNKGEIVLTSMKSHFGKEKYIIIFSHSNGLNRATVCKGIGNSIESAWNNGMNVVKNQLKKSGDTIQWFKVELVNSIEEQSYTSLLETITNTRLNYFRRGISFDFMFNQAFTDMEINGNAFIRINKKSNKKELSYSNINYYKKNNLCEKDSIDDKDLEILFTFNTIGYFYDGKTIYELETEGLNVNRRKYNSIEDKDILEIIENSSQYLASQVYESGQFRYGYFSCFDKEIDNYNILRHSSTLYSMIEAYEITKDEVLGESIKRALSYLKMDSIKVMNNIVGETRAFVIEKSNGNEIKLGANAAAILAFSKYTKVFEDNQYIELMEQLAEGIAFFQNKHNGSFVHVLNYPDLDIKEANRIIYYDGEAAFALMRLYELTNNEKWIEIVIHAFEWFLKNDYHNYHDHWLSYCSYELFKKQPLQKYLTFNLKNAEGILDFCLKRETTYPTLLELLMSTNNILKDATKMQAYTNIADNFDYNKFYAAIDYRVNNQLNGYFFEEIAMYYKRPQHILNSFFIRHHSYRVRIDDVEHNLSGFCQYYSSIK